MLLLGYKKKKYSLLLVISDPQKVFSKGIRSSLLGQVMILNCTTTDILVPLIDLWWLLYLPSCSMFSPFSARISSLMVPLHPPASKPCKQKESLVGDRCVLINCPLRNLGLTINSQLNLVEVWRAHAEISHKIWWAVMARFLESPKSNYFITQL